VKGPPVSTHRGQSITNLTTIGTMSSTRWMAYEKSPVCIKDEFHTKFTITDAAILPSRGHYNGNFVRAIQHKRFSKLDRRSEKQE